MLYLADSPVTNEIAREPKQRPGLHIRCVEHEARRDSFFLDRQIVKSPVMKEMLVVCARDPFTRRVGCEERADYGRYVEFFCGEIPNGLDYFLVKSLSDSVTVERQPCLTL